MSDFEEFADLFKHSRKGKKGGVAPKIETKVKKAEDKDRREQIKKAKKIKKNKIKNGIDIAAGHEDENDLQYDADGRRIYTPAEIRKKRRELPKGVVWGPFPPLMNKYGEFVEQWSSQQLFLSLDNPRTFVDVVLYHGTRYVGKSDVLLASYLKHVGKGWGRKWRGLIVRKTKDGLNDLIAKSHFLIPKTFPDAVYNVADKTWTFKTQETLEFNSIRNEQDYSKYHGNEIPFIGMDEATQWESDTVYKLLLTCNRVKIDDSTEEPVKCMFRLTTNPSDVGQAWVKKEFIRASNAGEIVTEKHIIDDEVVTFSKTHIFGSYLENPYADLGYIAKLKQLKDTNYAKYRSYLFGDWDVVLDGAFEAFRPSIHKKEPFTIPEDWYVDCSYDHGTSKPFSVNYYATADGITPAFLKDGTSFCPPKGSIILFAEDFGCKSPQEDNVGLKLSPSLIAKRLKEKEKKLLEGMILREHEKINYGVADSAIWNDRKVRGELCIADKFKQAGIKWQEGKKHGNAGRAARVELFNDLLVNTLRGEEDLPHFYVFNTCHYFIDTVIPMQRDPDNPDDVKADNDHAWDSFGYKLTHKRRTAVVN